MRSSRMSRPSHSLGAVLLLNLAGALLAASPDDGWKHWRGPAHNGVSSAEDLPESWRDPECLLWRTLIPGKGASTPLLVGDRLWVSASVDNNRELVVACLDANKGGLLWQKRVGPSRPVIRRGTPAAPSPVSDGKRVYFLFGTGLMSAFDLDGHVMWSRDLEKEFGRFQIKFGYASSPLLHDGKLYVALMRHKKVGRSFLIALDASDGHTLWSQERRTDAVDESRDSYASPILWEANGTNTIVLAGGDCLTGHSPEDGRELWRYDYGESPRHKMWRLVPTPVPMGELIWLPVPRGTSMLALRPESDGTVTKVWERESYAPDVCSALYYKKLLFVLDGNRKMMSCLDPSSGDELWRLEVPAEAVYRASPLGASGRIYCHSKAGECRVLEAGRKPVLLAAFDLEDNDCFAGLVPGRGCVYLRSDAALSCYGAHEGTPRARGGER